MKKSNINLRIYTGFFFALGLVLVVGASSYLSLQSQSEDAQWVAHTYKVQALSEKLLKTLVDMESGRRGYRATKDEKFLQPFREGAASLPGVNAELKQNVFDPINKKTVAEVEARMNELLAFWSSLDDGMVKKGDVLSNTTTEKQKMDAVRVVVERFHTRQTELLAKRSDDSERTNGYARTIIFIGIAIILIVVLILMAFILKEFRQRKKAEQQAEDNYQQVLVLNEEASKKNWILMGVAQINDSLQGSKELSELCTRVLDSIISYTGHVAGAVYEMNMHDQKLQLKAASGIQQLTEVNYALGEGLPGQAAKQKLIRVVNDIPAKYISISSATVDGQPGHAVYVPLYMGNDLKGVIEIFSWRSFTEAEQNLFKVIGDNIALAVNSAQADAEAKRLFEEVQQQKEELESQQEELRQTNEELSRQSEELQTSEEELRVQEEELRQINSELEEKNEAVETAMQALDIKAQELELTSKYKSEFLANMSHELRTPLNSILILAKLLSDNTPKNLNDKQVEYAGIIHKSGNDLLELINDILDLSKIEAGKVALQIEEVEIKSIERDIRLMFEAVSQQKGVVFETSIDGTLPKKLVSDKQRIEQVLKNLLSNAFKFTPQGGKVLLDFRMKDPGGEIIAISVKDSGIGIPPDKQQLIFQAFQQADGSTNRKYGGTGLGLSISKELAHLLGGKIELVSEAGKGSEFILILPLKKDVTITSTDTAEPVTNLQTVKLAAKVEQQELIADDRNDLDNECRSMLIVEDDTGFATILRDFARSKGYKTIVALRGDEGLYCATHYLPSAIILDMKLPEIDGATLLRQLKAAEATKKIPVHIISGSKDISLMQGDAIAWLEKPVSHSDLEKAFINIQQALNAQLKKVLLYSNDNDLMQSMQRLLKQHNKDVLFLRVTSLQQAAEKCTEENCDCIIIDMGADVEKEISNIQSIKNKIAESKTPLIICIDKDISPAVEIKLKRLSDVVIRTSTSSNQRLIEELELFLYKVQEEGNDLLRQVRTAETVSNELSGKKVLLADDDMRNVFSLNAALEMQQMQVITASDGKEAIEALQKDPSIDIVLMDIMMPEMDGYEAIRYIRKELNMKNIPIIALTAKAMVDDREKTIAAGASDYITKPVDLQKLFSLMRVWISQ